MADKHMKRCSTSLVIIVNRVKLLSRVRLFATPWTVAYQGPRPWDFPGSSPGVDCHFLLQGIFPTQGSNPGLPHCKQILYHLRHQGSLRPSYYENASPAVRRYYAFIRVPSIKHSDNPKSWREWKHRNWITHILLVGT